MAPLRKNGWLDYIQSILVMLFGQGCFTLHGAVIDGYGGVVISRGEPKNLEKNMLQCHFIYLESHLKSLGIEPGFPW
jgi:hypothetical protein